MARNMSSTLEPSRLWGQDVGKKALHGAQKSNKKGVGLAVPYDL